ncbi:DNA polymerase II large subunit, partial [archaeon]|nr:DNA polymerase II large subunit [archaeon]
IERPGKSAEVFPVDSIEGPIVLLESGAVKKIRDLETAKTIYPKVKKILFLGDLLVTLGDFRKTAHPLVPSGYVEEWWREELRKALAEGKKTGLQAEKFIKDPWNASQEEAMQLSLDLGIPLHSNFIHYYSNMDNEGLALLVAALKGAENLFEGNKVAGLKLEFNEKLKGLLELIGLEHELNDGRIVIGRDYAFSLLKTFGLLESGGHLAKIDGKKTALENINELSSFIIRDKSGTWVGSRMGRPEQAKPRKMIGDPHVLFPIGNYGGATRSINKAMNKDEKSMKKGLIEVELALFYCRKCKALREQPKCSVCNERAEVIKVCNKCGRIEEEKGWDKCRRCGNKLQSYSKRQVNLNELVLQAGKNLESGIPELVKGVKGMINDEKLVEPLEKGLLRAKHGVHVFRDATIRYESLNAPLTHFKPKEIGLSVEKAKALGYRKDIEGKELAGEEQLLELFPQDIILHDEGGDFFVKASKFIDDLLLRFYNQEPFYNAEKKEDLIGHLFLGLAPHTSAAVVGRLIGFTKSRLLWGHPYFHLAKRRNFDGDQDSALLLMDALLNFSQSYLSSGRGGRMDAPLVFTAVLNPKEVDDEVYELEICDSYPLELFEKAKDFADSKAIEVERVAHRLGTDKQYSGMLLTHSTTTFDEGPKTTRYVQLKSMNEKIHRQAKLQNKISAVEHKDALERVIASHFMPDIIGNARAFSRQTFRCGKCNEIYRRVPLKGLCKCGNKLILTVAEGSVTKYLDIAKEIITSYGLSAYLLQRINLVEKEIKSIFKNEKQQQTSLTAFM